MKLVTTIQKYSPMTLSDRLCWSVMVSRKSVSQYRIHNLVGLSRESIRQSVKVLHGFRLAKQVDKRWVALEPDDVTKPWFSWVKDSEGKPLGERLRYTKVIPGETGKGIAADCLLGLLRSLSRRGQTSTSCRRLKKMVGISDVTIKRLLKKFADKGQLPEVAFGRREVSWKMAENEPAREPKDATITRSPTKPRKSKPKQKPVPEPIQHVDPVKERLRQAGLRTHARPMFTKGDVLPCGCVKDGSFHPGRWSGGHSVKETGRIKVAADILRQKFPFDEVEVLSDEWECPRCHSKQKVYNKQEKLFLRLRTSDNFYCLAVDDTLACASLQNQKNANEKPPAAYSIREMQHTIA